jgi:hypothetical protein
MFRDLTHQKSKRLVEQLVDFVAESESHLKENEFLLPSTEILESAFDLYKQLEGQHSKGRFISLLAAFGCLLGDTTPDIINEPFGRVKVKDVKAWIGRKIGVTTRSRRLTAYKQYKSATKTVVAV